MLMRRVIQTTAALAAAVVTYTLVTLPPAHIRMATPLPPNVVLGAYHIHTTRSDGAGTPEDVAASAAQAGARFAILTDHGDGTRVPDAPRYVAGVLMIDAAEISTVEGHVVALGIPGAAPYRLGGEARDVIDDIHRLGGFAIVAHPDSQRADLKWRPAGVNGNTPFGVQLQGRQGGPAGTDLSGADGLEWLNADSEWREENPAMLINAVLHMPVRPAESFATLLNRPTATMRRWDGLIRRRTMVGLSAVDAHGLVAGLYRTTFQSFAQAVILDAPFSGDAASDAAALLLALRRGHAYTVVTGVADGAFPRFVARDDTQEVSIGERLSGATGPVHIEASIPAAAGARVVIMHNERSVAEGMGHASLAGAAEAGAYRLEIWLGKHRIPWIVTNPIYVDGPSTGPTAATPPGSPRPDAPRPALPAGTDAALLALPFDAHWAIEHGPSSTGTVTELSPGMAFRYNVGTAQPGSEFAALVHPIREDGDAYDRVEFMASAASPMRVSVQFRMPSGRDERWARSIYLDTTPRLITVRMSDLSPQGFSAARRPVAARVKAILFVVDTLNAAPGSTGGITMSDVRLRRSGESTFSGPNREQPVQRPGQEQQVGRPGRQGRGQ